MAVEVSFLSAIFTAAAKEFKDYQLDSADFQMSPFASGQIIKILYLF
jgi:hypothetical protein